MATNRVANGQEQMDAEDLGLRIGLMRTQVKDAKQANAAAKAARSAEKYRRMEYRGLRDRFCTLLEWPDGDPKEIQELAAKLQSAKVLLSGAMNDKALAEARKEMVEDAFDAAVERFAYEAARTEQARKTTARSSG